MSVVVETALLVAATDIVVEDVSEVVVTTTLPATLDEDVSVAVKDSDNLARSGGDALVDVTLVLTVDGGDVAQECGGSYSSVDAAPPGVAANAVVINLIILSHFQQDKL